ncbi:PREDICTED: uncharacterized protein LOC106792110 [Polistes canadensis]|uniref:uncharacterized protein LOC106792110 n=1 Tax=Polistes canadensis TaxID=91411 RepID=UPI000718F4B4|nr:PREDICTED: uncharacterized protein LOC106792110 [Polistes canadensis]
MQQSAACMPLLQHDAAIPSKSVCSSANSCSHFESCSTELNEELNEMQTDNSIITEVINKSLEYKRTIKCSQSPREISQSDSKIESGRNKKKPSDIFKTASTKTMCVRQCMNRTKNCAMMKRSFIKKRSCKMNYKTVCLDPSI